MSIENEIIRLQNAKASIKTAIENKGVEVGDNVKLDNYAELIDSITVGSGDGEEHVNPDFYNLRTINGTDYSYLFNYYRGTNLDCVSNWDTSKVTDMGSMFYYSTVTSLDVSKWNTSNVKNTYGMFQNCSELVSLDLSGWNTSNVTNMNNMFSRCNKLISVDLSGWDTSNVTGMSSLFNGSSTMALTNVKGELDLSGLTNGFYPNSANDPLRKCANLETLYLKNIYKNCTMKNESKWSINLGETIIKDECLLYIINELPDLINDKKLTTTNNIILTLPKTNTLTEEQVKVATDKGWQVANTTYQLPSYNVSYDLENVTCTEKLIAKEGMPFSLILEAIDNYCIDSITVTMGGTTITPKYIKDTDGFNILANINITSVTGDIYIIASAKEAIRYSSFTVGVADENNTLCIKPSTTNSIKEVKINGESQVVPSGSTTKSYIVRDGDNIEIRGQFNLENSTVLSISNFILSSNIIDTKYMFNKCYSLTSLDLSKLDTSKVTDMSVMFANCYKLTSLDLSNFNTLQATNINYMFSGCDKLTSLDLSSFDTRNVTTYNGVLTGVPASATIYINPDTFINKSTGVTFTPAELNWYGTFSVKPQSNPSNPSEPNSPLTPQQAEYTTFTMGPTETGILVVLNNHDNSVQELYVENIPQDLPQVSITQLLNGEISEEIEITTLVAILPVKEGDTIKIKGGFSLMMNMLFENMISISDVTIQSNLEDCSYMFAGCVGLTETPVIPINAVNCDSMFTVTGITEAPVIPKNVKNCKDMFSGAAITKAPLIPEGVTNCINMFSGCVSLTEANITIPSSATDCSHMFNGCVSLTKAPTISEGVINTNCMFMGCTSLTTAAVIPTTVTNCVQMYSGCTNLQDITQQNVNLMPTFTGYCQGCYEECTKIVEPISYTEIPNIWREP